MPPNIVKRLQNHIVLSLCLLLFFTNFILLLAQEEPPPDEPPPTVESPTLEPPTLEPPTATFTEIPPTATNTEFPTLTPTETETVTSTPTSTLTPTETETETATPTSTLTPTEQITLTPSLTPTFTPTPTFAPTLTLGPTPGAPDYQARAQELENRNRRQSLSEECGGVLNSDYAVVASSIGSRADEFYDAITQAHLGGSASPYPIFLCPGSFPLDETVVLYADIIIYGRGLDAVDGSTIFQSNTTTMGGMFTLNDGSLLEFHNVIITGGQAVGIADTGGVVRIWEGSLGIYDSKLVDNYAEFLGGVIAGGDDTEIARSFFVNNTADDSGGVMYGGGLTATCVRFDTNEATLVLGGALAIYGGEISSSSFTGNTAGQEANHIFNYDWGDTTDATGNWWASSPSSPADISSSVDSSSPLGSDPTSTYSTEDYYDSSPCTMSTPVPLPGLTCPSESMNRLTEEECPPTLDDFGIVLEGDPEDWSLVEWIEILQAAIDTGNALYAHGVDAVDAVEAFRIVLEGKDAFDEWREIRFYRFSGPDTYCTTTNFSTGTESASIACDPGVNVTRYTAVHEFGHVFVGRTGGEVSGTNTFYGLVEFPGGPGTGLFSSGIFVMGPRSLPIQGGSLSDWQRSDFVLDNGWGSAAQWDQVSEYEYPVLDLPTTTPSGPIATGYPVRIPAIGPCGPGSPTDLPPVFGTPFPMQQNPCTFSDEFAVNGTGLITERVEAAADMFLNWVYWKNYGPPLLNPTGTPTPSGFGDIRWRYASLSAGGNCYPSGCDDPVDSGQARQTWMDNTMSDLFTEFGW